MMKRNRVLSVGAAFMVLICIGCAHPLKTRMESDFDPAKPMRVAVMPFAVKKKSQQQGAEKIRRAFAAHLQESNYDIADIAYVDRVLAANGWLNVGEIQTVPPQELGEALGVDAIIYGEVKQWDKLYVVVHAHGAMAAKADMVDARTGRWLWTTEKDAIRMKGILKAPVIIYMAPIPPTQFALQGFEMNEMTDELTREMVKPVVNAAKEGPSYAVLLEQRPKPLSTERALALQKSVLEPDRHYAEAPKTEPPPARAEVAAADEDFAVQLCATRRPAGAQQLVSQLQAKGYAAYLVTADVPGLGQFHRVRIRGFASRKEALAYGFEIRTREGLPFWVDKASDTAPIACW